MNAPLHLLSTSRRRSTSRRGSTGAGRCLAAGLLLLLSACATRPPETPPGDLSWEEHRARVLAHEGWRLQGRLNIRGPERNDTVNLTWEQQGESFAINMSGRLGLGNVRINGNETGVVVEKAGEEPLYARSLEDVSADYLGYEFPAAKLHYWVRGITTPDSPASMELNDNRRLASLASDGWRLDYDRYLETGGVVLPGRIRMEHPPWRLTFLISEWTLHD